MLISTIIPTLNRAPQLKRVLDILIQDEYPYKEIIVCDGASTDGTIDLLKSFDGHVRWISEPDRGEYEARNKGLLLASGDIIKYMSDDDVLLPGSFAYAAQYFEAKREVDILFGQSIWFDERRGRESTVCDTRLRGNDSITLRNFIRMSYPLANSESVFFRHRVIDRIGMFDVTLHGADYDYWIRAVKAGLNIAICDRVFVHYHLSDLSGVERKGRQLLYETWRLACRYGDWRDMLFIALFRIPSRLIVLGVMDYFPIIGIPVRNAWGRWKSRRTVE